MGHFTEPLAGGLWPRATPLPSAPSPPVAPVAPLAVSCVDRVVVSPRRGYVHPADSLAVRRAVYGALRLSPARGPPCPPVSGLIDVFFVQRGKVFLQGVSYNRDSAVTIGLKTKAEGCSGAERVKIYR